MDQSNAEVVVSFEREAIDKAVKQLARAGVGLTRAVERVLVMAVYDSIVNKTPDTANALMGALRKSTKATAIGRFLVAFGQLHKPEGERKYVHFAQGAAARLEWNPEYVETVQDAATAWESFKPDTETKPTDMIKGIENLIARGKRDGVQVIDAELVPYLEALLAQYTSRKALEAAKASAAADETVVVAMQEAATA